MRQLGYASSLQQRAMTVIKGGCLKGDKLLSNAVTAQVNLDGAKQIGRQANTL